MHSIVILADQPRWNSYYSIVFPLYKWKNLFNAHDINIRITTDKDDRHLKDADTAIIISRAFSEGWQNIQLRNRQNEAELIAYLINLKRTVKNLVWYDRSDSSGSTDFPIIQYVDIFLKNQILKDINYYSQHNGARGIRQWLTDIDNLEPHFKIYYPCPTHQLYKIKLGWNITHSDHRVFKGRERIISNYIFGNPKIYKSSIQRRLDFSLRGNLGYGGINASFFTQRNEVKKLLNELTKYKSLTSEEKISKQNFIKELSETKVCVSPFGLGEICYRDFEIFMAGSLLIKPSLEHLSTFPEVFFENETYIPVSWGMDDFKQKIVNILDNYSKYIYIAENGQNIFLNSIQDGQTFVKHIKKIIV